MIHITPDDIVKKTKTFADYEREAREKREAASPKIDFPYNHDPYSLSHITQQIVDFSNEAQLRADTIYQLKEQNKELSYKLSNAEIHAGTLSEDIKVLQNKNSRLNGMLKANQMKIKEMYKQRQEAYRERELVERALQVSQKNYKLQLDKRIADEHTVEHLRNENAALLVERAELLDRLQACQIIVHPNNEAHQKELDRLRHLLRKSGAEREEVKRELQITQDELIEQRTTFDEQKLKSDKEHERQLKELQAELEQQRYDSKMVFRNQKRNFTSLIRTLVSGRDVSALYSSFTPTEKLHTLVTELNNAKKEIDVKLEMVNEAIELRERNDPASEQAEAPLFPKYRPSVIPIRKVNKLDWFLTADFSALDLKVIAGITNPCTEIPLKS